MSNKRTQDELEPDSDVEFDIEDSPPPSSRSPSQSKRARLEEDEEPEAARERLRREEEEWEALHEEAIRQSLTAKAGRKGTIAEYGVIQQIDLVNFLCHKNLTVKFGPQINFVIGHNGSGKSAVLTGIAVALGGKASSTGRGTGLKSFIKEGETASEVTIRIKNDGTDAYKPNVFGKSIVITRHFNASGSSGYKIKSSLDSSKKGAEKVISTKREELNAITDHMGIQVDNPLNILTQDLSRQFIGTSSPAEKYQFFLKGTQLQQLSEEYEIIQENIIKTGTVLQQKSEALPELRVAYTQAAERWKQATHVREQQTKVDELSRELAWAHVHEKEKELRAKSEEVAKEISTFPKMERKITECQTEYDALSARITKAEGALKDLGASQAVEIAALDEKKKKLIAEKKTLETERSELKNDEAKVKISIRAAAEEIRRFSDQIQVEERKLADDHNGKRAALEKKILDLQDARIQSEATLEDLQREITAGQANRLTKENDLSVLLHKKEEASKALGDAYSHKKALESRLQNKYNAWGNNIPAILNAVQNAVWLGEMPTGPIGDFVDLLDQKWIEVARVAIGSLMSSWVITNAGDRKQLMGIFKRFQNRANIIVSQRDLFDYSRGEPALEFTTILRVLNVQNEFVKRVLINVAHIEATCLANSRREADDILSRTGIKNRFMTLDLFNVVRYAEGGGSSIPMSPFRSTLAPLFTGTDSDVRRTLEGVTAQIARLGPEVEEMANHITALRSELQGIIQANNRAITSKNNIEAALIRDNHRLEALRLEASDAAPAEISALEEVKREQEREKERFMQDLQSILQKIADKSAQIQPFDGELEKIEETRKEILGRRRSLDDEIVNDAGQRATVEHTLRSWQDKYATAKKKAEKLEEQARVVEEEFTDWSAKAADRFGDKIERPRPSAAVQAEREKLKTMLKVQERKLGATVDELSAEVNRASTAYKSAKADFNELNHFNKNLKTSMQSRVDKWMEFRRHISIRIKNQFTFYLATRGFYGKVILDHGTDAKAGTLNLRVQTEEQIQAGGDKDPKSLSGGEKSFSTICLLLALWETIGCPIRCLDEFDVFMDAVNRKISMKMMIETAKSTDRQYVLITPLDISNVPKGPEVRIHRMTDPERRQMNLNFDA